MGNMKYMTKKPKIVLMIPYPAQGHVTPMLKLASIFLNQGYQPVIVLPEYIHHQIMCKIEQEEEEEEEKIVCMAIPDGMDKEIPIDFFAIEASMENNMPSHLESLIAELVVDGDMGFVVVDLLASWAIEVANRCGISVAGFWPAMLATYRLISAIPELLRSGLISDTGIPQQQLGQIYLSPDQPKISTEDLPWLIGTISSRKERFKFWTRTLARSTTLKWILINSFPDEYNCLSTNQKLKNQILTKTTTEHNPHVLPIGPLCKPTITKSPTFWKEDMSCLDWLDKQKPNSVIYVSFGSWVSPIGEGKVKSLGLALEALGKPFIWVLGNSWRSGLPNGYIDRVSKKLGKVVSWAPQMEVLQHMAVSCYLTHCGWNSTMEAIQSQKRLLCYPVAGDQFVNCAYIVKVWKIGKKLDGFGVKDVEEGLRNVMEDIEIDKRLRELYDRIMGVEADFRVLGNLKTFMDGIENQKVGNLVYNIVHEINF